MRSVALELLALAHFGALGGLALYGCHRLWLLSHWFRQRKDADAPPPHPLGDPVPCVTVQLPLYNERFVAARLIDAVALLDWPRDRLEIQVLDDSTDDTRSIVDERVAYWSEQGIDIHVLRRPQRSGYKAGALSDGLARAVGSLVAIFDADFVPAPDFLRCTVPYFEDPGIGMVQTRWEFLDGDRSWLTRIQAQLLAPHFSIEHRVRCRRGLFFNFNGTAGVWRRVAIDASGGWQADTVTEDLDLSYRAQLAGWRFLYLDDYAVPSELPATLADFRSQQQRWAKGSIQTARKILPRLLRSSQPPAVKIEALFHLLANLGWLLGTFVILTLYPAILWRSGVGPYQILRLEVPLLLAASIAVLFYFFLHAAFRGERRSVLWLPLLPVLSIGLAPSLALAVVRGAFTRGGVFRRTPKFGRGDRRAIPHAPALYRQRPSHQLVFNLCILAYISLPLSIAWQNETWLAVPLLLLFSVGFSLVILQECGDWLRAVSRLRA